LFHTIEYTAHAFTHVTVGVGSAVARAHPLSFTVCPAIEIVGVEIATILFNVTVLTAL